MVERRERHVEIEHAIPEWNRAGGAPRHSVDGVSVVLRETSAQVQHWPREVEGYTSHPLPHQRFALQPIAAAPLRHARQRRGQEVRHGLHRQRHLALALVLVHPVIAAGDDRGRDSGVGGRLDGLSDGQHYNANVNRSGTWEQPTRAGCASEIRAYATGYSPPSQM